MSTGSEDIRDIKGTYIGELLDYKSEYRITDFWALVCCGWDLHHPYEGWSGYVAVPVFADAPTIELYFGDFPNSLAEYENVPDYLVNRSVSKLSAYDQLCSHIMSVSNNPVFISANADTWSRRILSSAAQESSGHSPEFDHICVRKLYSLVNSEELIAKGGSQLSDVFSLAKPLSKRFGLHAIAEAMHIHTPCNSTKPLHRAQLLQLLSAELLLSPYPLQ